MTILPYRDPSQPIERRIDDLLGRMTIEEKVGQLLQINGQPHAGDQLGLWKRTQAGSVLCIIGEDTVPYQRAAQDTRLGIPVLFGIDATHGHSMWHGATMFPSQLGLACAWDRTLAHDVARATAREMAHTGIPWTFSPVLCLPRDLRWGRVDETFGEDPFLIGELGAAMVRGYQGGDLTARDSVAACAKHFAGYGDTAGGRDASESDHSRRKMRALFLPPFKAAVEAGVASLMTGYHVVDGTPCTANRWLLTEILRDEWKSDATVVTDWDNLGRMVNEQRVCADFDEAARRALLAGNDLIMNSPAFFEAVQRAVAAGSVPMSAIDQGVRRVLRLKFRLGLFEDPRLPDGPKAAAVVGCPGHRALARDVARRSLVLLKNRNRMLPLDRTRLGQVAVIGPFADDDLEQNGDWSLGAGQRQGLRERHPRACTVTIRDAFESVLGRDRVRFAEGCTVPTAWVRPWSEPWWFDARSGDDAGRIQRAVDAARGADLAVVVVGDGINHTGEERSTATLELPGSQLELLQAVQRTGTPLVVVLQSGKPLAIPQAVELADAFLVQFTPGMEGGNALVDVLLGDAEPEGRLPISFPVHVGQQPVFYNQTPGTHGDRYADLPDHPWKRPLFSFGQGQTYTRFAYRLLRLATRELTAGASLVAEVGLWNMGERSGTETVQWYLSDRATSVTWPERRLIAFEKVRLAPGTHRVVRLELPYDRLALCDADGRWVVEPGEFELMVGPSSREDELLKERFLVR